MKYCFWSVVGETHQIDWCVVEGIKARDPDEACWKAMHEHGMIEVCLVEREA